MSRFTRWTVKGNGFVLSSKLTVMGWGRCSVSGCPCPAFVKNLSNPDLCDNCGHPYKEHWLT